jgi:hypothetical protein
MTVDDCRRFEKMLLGIKLSEKELKKKYSKEEIRRHKNIFSNVLMYMRKGQRYSEKEDAIREWRQRDIKKDERLKNAKPLESICCLGCKTEMNCTMKDLWEKNKRELVLFFYECSACFLRRAFFEDGEEYRSKKEICSDCGAEIEVSREMKNDLMKIEYRCPSCDTIKTEELDFSEKKEKVAKNFIKDRERFCMTKEEGIGYFNCVRNLERASKLLKEEGPKKKEVKVKQLKISDVEKIILEAVRKNGYSEIKLGEPEIKKDVIVEFNVYDKKEKREEYDSRMQLKKLIENTLTGTNWKLMSDGIFCKLGILRGRLRGEEEVKDDL